MGRETLGRASRGRAGRRASFPPPPPPPSAPLEGAVASSWPGARGGALRPHQGAVQFPPAHPLAGQGSSGQNSDLWDL